MTRAADRLGTGQSAVQLVRGSVGALRINVRQDLVRRSRKPRVADAHHRESCGEHEPAMLACITTAPPSPTASILTATVAEVTKAAKYQGAGSGSR